MDKSGVKITVVFLSVIAIAMVRWLWQRKHMENADSWPLTEATIESGALEVVKTGELHVVAQETDVELPVFAFSYQVAGDFYSGRFALRPYITDPGQSLISRMTGRKLQVRYDPSHPDVWFIPEKLIEGCRVEQKIGSQLIGFYPND